jgi:hypothetical protein
VNCCYEGVRDSKANVAVSGEYAGRREQGREEFCIDGGKMSS